MPIPSWCAPQPLITETLKLEEGRFKKTLGTGLQLLEDETRGLGAGGSAARATSPSSSTTPSASRST